MKITKINKLTNLTKRFVGGIAQPPFKSDTLVYLDGTIIEDSGSYYFLDKSGNDRNFLITDYDFQDRNIKGLPYKSAATISAPVGDATLIAGDINNFLYDSGGTPNQIPVVSFFQDIDYEHKLFCKHSGQVLDVITGVELQEPYVKEIVLYDNVKSGQDLIDCQVYYNVPEEIVTNVKWVDGSVATTGSGTKASPYKTLNELRNQTFDIAYVKTSEYTETLSTLNWLPNRDGTYKSIGGVVVKGTNAGTGVCYPYNMNGEFDGFVFDADNTIQFAMRTDRAGYTNNFTRCLFINSTSSTIQYANATALGNVKNSVIEIVNTAYGTYGQGGLNLDSNYIFGTGAGTNVTVYLAGESEIKHNLIEVENQQQIMGIYADALFTIFDNTFNSSSRWFVLQNVDSVLNSDLIFTYNSIIPSAGLTTQAAISPLVRTKNGWNVTIDYNTVSITDLTTWAATPETAGMFYIYEPNTVQVNSNIITMLNKVRWDAISLLRATGSTISTIISGNYIRTNQKDGLVISVGGEGTTGTNHFNEAEIYNNRIIGIFEDYPNEVGVGIHGILFNKSININCKFNYISGVWGGIIPKAAGGGDYTLNGTSYNLIEDVNTGIWCRGISGIKIANNTIKSNRFNTEALKVDDFGAQSKDVIFINNIVDFGNDWVSYCVFFDDFAASNGCEVQNCIFYSIDESVFLKTDSQNYSVGSAISSGLASDIILNNPDLTNLIPNPNSPAIGAGKDLGSDYRLGLDSSTDWSGDLPNVITKNQGNDWDIGAYINDNAEYTYLTDDDGNLLTDDDGNLLIE